MILAYLALALAALPAVVGLINLLVLRTPRVGEPSPGTLVSILVPARNEAANIGACLEAARASEGVAVEVVVMDDGSDDGTPAIVSALAAKDARIRLERAPPLPVGWTGKVHACARLAEAARGTHFLFVDADVRLAPHAAAALLSHARKTGAALVSAVPRQIMRTPGEMLLVPTINFIMLGYLPIPMMRTRPDPSLGAACGQLVLVERRAYEKTGGHGAIRTLLHDGIQLARAMRRRGYATDLVAGADLAACRMYDRFADAWSGFLKNAHEGMATPRQLPVWTVLLAGGHVLPVIVSAAALKGAAPLAPALAALALSLGLRTAITLRSRESLWTIPLHPVSVATGLAVQWAALLRSRRGRPAGWKGRLYAAD